MVAASTPSGRLPEALLLFADKGRGLLLRLHHLRAEFSDPNSDVFFLRDKPFQSMLRHVSAATAKGGNLFSAGPPGGKAAAEEIARTAAKIRKSIHPHFETLIDATDFCEGVVRHLLPDCAALALDTTRTPDLAKLYLDVVTTYVCLIMMLSRCECHHHTFLVEY